MTVHTAFLVFRFHFTYAPSCARDNSCACAHFCIVTHFACSTAKHRIGLVLAAAGCCNARTVLHPAAPASFLRLSVFISARRTTISAPALHFCCTAPHLAVCRLVPFSRRLFTSRPACFLILRLWDTPLTRSYFTSVDHLNLVPLTVHSWMVSTTKYSTLFISLSYLTFVSHFVCLPATGILMDRPLLTAYRISLEHMFSQTYLSALSFSINHGISAAYSGWVF